MQSALLNPSPVQEYLAKECIANRVLGPIPPTAASSIHMNRFGVIPKRRQPGKWRLILDLSFPPGRSVNDGIPPDLCSLQFTTVDNAAQLITRLGRGALLAKIDISHAYRNVPVHPNDRRLLGMAWNGSVFADTTLPFRFQSAPKIFCAISYALEWVLCREGVSSCLHYIDHFLTAGVPNSTQCAQNLQLLQSTCHRLGLPLATEKIEGPTAVLTFLGVEFDTDQMQMWLPQEKLDHLQVAVSGCLQRKVATKREMRSLIGELAHACKVVEAGRTFLRRLLDLTHSLTRLDHWTRLVYFLKSHEAVLRIQQVCVMVDDFWCDLATLQAPRMVRRDVLLVFQVCSFPCLFDELNLRWVAS